MVAGQSPAEIFSLHDIKRLLAILSFRGDGICCPVGGWKKFVARKSAAPVRLRGTTVFATIHNLGVGHRGQMLQRLSRRFLLGSFLGGALRPTYELPDCG